MTLRDLPDLRALHDLGERLSGDVVTPDAEGWEAARQAWNLAVDQRPVAVAYPETADDIATIVRFAAEHGIRIAFNAGGHNAGPMDWAADTHPAEDRADACGQRGCRGAASAGRSRGPRLGARGSGR